ncbi:MAG: nuclear transport factor 2 family protein [Burkholderiaceae bacterium]|nr:MAG: nuclear transport factor 2 family protein [Burkholderiaceae bacterium]
MSPSTRDVIEAHWRFANARDWGRFDALLHPDLNYEVPQTREYVEGAAGYSEMFRTWPGDWRVTVRHLVCEEARAVCVIDFHVDGCCMTGISFFALAGGLITEVTDYWPEPYEPPTRATPVMKRRPAAQ